MHTIGIEISLDLKVSVWGFCPHSEEERLSGVSCSEMVRVDLPPEPLPRPYRDGGVWRVECHNCSGSGRVMSSSGYKRPVRCPLCAGSGHGYEVTTMHPWFRWSELAKVEPTGRCVIERNPNHFRNWAKGTTAKTLESGKLVTMIELDYDPTEDPAPIDYPENLHIPNEWVEPTEAEWTAILNKAQNDMDIRPRN